MSTLAVGLSFVIGEGMPDIVAGIFRKKMPGSWRCILPLVDNGSGFYRNNSSGTGTVTVMGKGVFKKKIKIGNLKGCILNFSINLSGKIFLFRTPGDLPTRRSNGLLNFFQQLFIIERKIEKFIPVYQCDWL
jgi:hypothetical protein